MDPIETFKVDDLTVSIHYDEDPRDPREWDNVGTMIHWHSRYDLGDRKIDRTEQDALERGGVPLLFRYLRRFEGATHMIKLGLYDHSGLTMYAGGGTAVGDAAGWDSGTVGVIFDTSEGRKITGCPPEHIDQALRGEIEEYDQFLRGAVYAYQIVNDEGDTLDSCGSFYSLEDATNEARAIAESYGVN